MAALCRERRNANSKRPPSFFLDARLLLAYPCLISPITHGEPEMVTATARPRKLTETRTKTKTAARATKAKANARTRPK